MNSTRFDPTDPDYFYPHAAGTIPQGAATIVDAHGATWHLSTARAVPTGLYLWGYEWPETGRWVFRTLPQIRSQRGAILPELEAGKSAETAQFNAAGV